MGRGRRPEPGGGRPAGDGQGPEEGCCKEAWEEGLDGGLKGTRAWWGVGCGVRGAGVGGSSLDGRRVETEAWLGSSWSLGGVKGLTAARRQKRRERPGPTRVRWSGKGRLRLSLGGAGVPLPPGGWGPVGVQTWPRCATPLSLQLKNMPRCWSRVKTAVCKATHPEHVLTTASP